jgi:hexosaminidase
MLPASIDSKEVQNEAWLIPTGVVRDHPRFEWRGVMLDVARHFFGPEDVKKYIDLAAYYKLNRFHIHLSDDQGWRIEIKSRPNLVEVGSKMSIDFTKTGYFTQEDYAGLVKYADDRYITLIPEIDMPAHTNAALLSYPELNCSDPGREAKPYPYSATTLCTNKDTTYKFIDDVVREISSLTTGKYFHIGGDEAFSTDHAGYLKFIERVQKIITANNKIMIGWEEIAQSNIEKSTIAQLWQAETNEIAVSKSNKAVISPGDRIYFDMKYDSTTKIGTNWAGYLELDRSYNWDPADNFKGLSQSRILGVEAPLWTETVKQLSDIEYLTASRLPGLAELGWTQQKDRNWDKYRIRLAMQGKRLSLMGVNYYKSPLIDWK